MTDVHKKWIAGTGIGVFLLLSALLFWFAGKPLITFVSEPEQFRLWVDGHGIGGRLAFLGMVVLQIFVAVIPGEPLEIAAGYAFGFLEGTSLCLLGMTVGGILVFAFVRQFGVMAVEVFFPRKKIEAVGFFQNHRRVLLVTILLFLLPGTPKDLLSYVAGLSKIRFREWLLITSICRLPSVVTSTMGGNALGSGEISHAVIIFAATICISLAGLAIYQRLTGHKTGEG